jgi:hypothetical protein
VKCLICMKRISCEGTLALSFVKEQKQRKSTDFFTCEVIPSMTMKESMGKNTLRAVTMYQFHMIVRDLNRDRWELNRSPVKLVREKHEENRKLMEYNKQVSLLGNVMSVEWKENVTIYTIDNGMGRMVNAVVWPGVKVKFLSTGMSG